MSATQEWIKQKFQEESAKNPIVTVHTLRKQIDEMKERIKKLETDMAYSQHSQNEVSASSPEEQRIYELRRTD